MTCNPHAKFKQRGNRRKLTILVTSQTRLVTQLTKLVTREQIAATLIINELLPRLRRHKLTIDQSPIPPEHLASLASLKAKGTLSTHQIRSLMDAAFNRLSA